MADLRVVELFAGVGGFRLGFDRAGGFRTIWANQWEPGVKAQHAAAVYERHFGPQPETFNVDVASVDPGDVPDHDILCGGFPCQDYSVATPNARGMDGEKGILWWQIRRLIDAKRPRWVVLENVDRLLCSPARQRGRDFAVILACFRDLGYRVAWRVVNAADYGAPQRRRRVFIVAISSDPQARDPGDVLFSAFPAEWVQSQADRLTGTVKEISDTWGRSFLPAGSMEMDGSFQHGRVHASRGDPGAGPGIPAPRSRDPGHEAGIRPAGSRAPAPGIPGPATLGDVLLPGPGRELGADLERWEYVKGRKDEPRTAKNGYMYRFREGSIPFPDPLDVPARTILTSEGGKSPNRTTHVVRDPATAALRLLRPVEAERLQGFPDDWTEGVPENWRFKLMGNALVVGMVERIGRAIQAAETSSPGSPELEPPLTVDGGRRS